MTCPTCKYESMTAKGCDNPGCADAWFVPASVKAERDARYQREQEAQAERERINAIRSRIYGGIA